MVQPHFLPCRIPEQPIFSSINKMPQGDWPDHTRSLLRQLVRKFSFCPLSKLFHVRIQVRLSARPNKLRSRSNQACFGLLNFRRDSKINEFQSCSCSNSRLYRKTAIAEFSLFELVFISIQTYSVRYIMRRYRTFPLSSRKFESALFSSCLNPC